jgi:hypothetical protein
LSTNNLFVDYLNEFLLNPELGEQLRFNFVTGDLELIDSTPPETPDSVKCGSDFLSPDENKSSATRRARYENNRAIFSSTAESVKRRLETQLKSIIKKTSTPINNKPSSTPSSTLIKKLDILDINPNRASSDFLQTNINNYKQQQLSALATDQQQHQQQLFDQINKHSFKDLDLIRIEARIDTADLKDPKAAADARIPVVNTRYSVNALKKPFSLKWLRTRRLALFLQSELYNEFKLAMILAQFGLFNKDLSTI